MSNDIEKLIKKIIRGGFEMSKEELQLYVNNVEEIEQRLINIQKQEVNNV